MNTDERRIEMVRKIIQEAKEMVKLRMVVEHLPHLVESFATLLAPGWQVVMPPDTAMEGQLADWRILGKCASQKKEMMALAPLLNIYPLRHADQGLPTLVERFKKRDFSAAYHPISHTVILDIDRPETKQYLAVSFLHQLGYAFAAVQENRVFAPVKKEPAAALNRKVRTWTTEAWLTYFLGNAVYRKEVENLARLLHWWHQGYLSDYPILTGKGKYLDACFGPLADKGKEEETHRDGLFGLYCSLLAAEWSCQTPAETLAWKHETLAKWR